MVNWRRYDWIVDRSMQAWDVFVDDGRLSLSIIDWVASIPFLHYVKIDPDYNGLCLVAGLAGLLIENIIRRTRRPKKAASDVSPETSLLDVGENN